MVGKRAYSDVEKQAKRQKIIDAAESLLVKGVFPLPSVNQIIAKAGVAKGTVYLYFGSKEEIYLALLAQYFEVFNQEFMQVIIASDKNNLIDNFAAIFIGFAKNTPKAVYLASIVPLILENNVADDYLLGFKKSLFGVSKSISQAMAKVANGHDKAEFLVRFLLSYNQFLALWQHCNPPEKVENLMKQNGLSELVYDFDQQFGAQMQRTWADLI
ncbi:MAG: TetR/AcrR family transcriptional regulator [Rhizobiales bacterium]|nr:TetR/AcrR family transcriptional regulator [Hyphomicrobiales bacterium]NRB13021.1 TetR/AcrR family transcriptional regulator [Hyphomicrobiales bacterium]